MIVSKRISATLDKIGTSCEINVPVPADVSASKRVEIVGLLRKYPKHCQFKNNTFIIKYDTKEDADIDNDGDTDKTDKYLLNRRKAIAKAMQKEGHDHEVAMAVSSLEAIAEAIVELRQKLGNVERNIPGWIQDHITNAENYIEQAAQGFHELKNDE
jgi:hypothetical protein